MIDDDSPEGPGCEIFGLESGVQILRPHGVPERWQVIILNAARLAGLVQEWTDPRKGIPANVSVQFFGH